MYMQIEYHICTLIVDLHRYIFQPHAIPFRDAVQQFCEKHMDKIKAYMEHVFVRLPVPIKANFEGKEHLNVYLNHMCARYIKIGHFSPWPYPLISAINLIIL